MYLTAKQQVKRLSAKEFQTLRQLSHTAKNLVNEAIYNVRQYYFEEGEYLNYEKNYTLLKTSSNYKALNSNMAQQLLKEVDGMFKSFFGLLKLAKKGKYRYHDIQLPKYLPKDGFTTLVIGMVRINDHQLTIPYSREFGKTHEKITIKLPPLLRNKKIKEIRIIPKAHAKFFEIQYIYEVAEIQRNLSKNKALALDLGVNNLVTAATSTGEAFIVDGRRLKSINQWYNKRNAYLQRINDKQRLNPKKRTAQQSALLRDRNNKVNDYMSKAARMVIDYCIEHDIGVLVVGYNETFQQNSRLGRRNNQTFTMIPFGKLRDKLEYLCQLNGITYIKQEESYTSKSSFFDQDILPTYNADNPQTFVFSGKRVKRGLYQTFSGFTLNADVNGALNILKKSSVVSVKALYGRGEVDTPIRIRVQ